MLTSLRLKNFKNFADETLRMGPFTIIVGANASGKSNIRDALRFLHGVGRGYTLADILGGKYGSGGQVEWEQVRGNMGEVVRFGHQDFTLSLQMKLNNREIQYSITVGKDDSELSFWRVKKEELCIGWTFASGSDVSFTTETIYTSHPAEGDPVRRQEDDNHLLLRMDKTGRQRKFGQKVEVRPDQPALTQIREHKRVVRAHKNWAQLVVDELVGMRFLDLSPHLMREPAFPGQTTLGDSGQNLPAVLREISKDPAHRKTLVDWTRALTPMDVGDFAFPDDPITGRIQLAFHEANGRKVSACAASDGTLRFLTILASLLGPNRSGLHVFEEIDNGIHPSRQHLLLDLIDGQTKGEVLGGASPNPSGKDDQGRNIQVVTTTHSPDMLAMLRDETFRNTSVVCRNPDTEDAIIRPVAELPNAEKLRRSQGLRKLHATGWMEDILYFSQDGEQDQSS